MRVDPPPSLAVANGTRPAATAAADPPLDPPGVRVGVPRVAGRAPRLGVGEAGGAELGRRRLAHRHGAGGRSRATCTESSATGPRPLKSSEPCDVGMPAQSSRSFTPKGTPASGPGVLAARHRGVDRVGRRPGLLHVEVHERVEPLVAGLDGVEALVEHLHRLLLAPPYRFRNLDDGPHGCKP